MEKYKYRAVNAKGRPVRGVISAANETDLFHQLQKTGMELVECTPLSKKAGGRGRMLLSSIKIREMIQLFIHMEQMQDAGVPMLDALADIRDTSDNDYLRDVISECYRDVSEGSSLSDALAKHPKVFTELYVALIASGEETGDLPFAYRNLVKYLKWLAAMQARVRKATRYPMIVTVVVLLTVVLMMAIVVPQIVGFISNLDQELPFYTKSLIATSNFFVAWWWAVLAGIIGIVSAFFSARKLSESMAYKIDLWILNAPVAGALIRKINIARFAQTFSSLFSSGVDILSALKSAQGAVRNRALSEALGSVQEYVRSGKPLSESLNGSGEFPSMVVRMVRVGEESGNLSVVLDQVSDFYSDDVDEEVQKLIAMIEPSLTVILGGIILWIAVGVFGPIYSSFETIQF